MLFDYSVWKKSPPKRRTLFGHGQSRRTIWHINVWIEQSERRDVRNDVTPKELPVRQQAGEMQRHISVQRFTAESRLKALCVCCCGQFMCSSMTTPYLLTVKLCLTAKKTQLALFECELNRQSKLLRIRMNGMDNESRFSYRVLGNWRATLLRQRGEIGKVRMDRPVFFFFALHRKRNKNNLCDFSCSPACILSMLRLGGIRKKSCGYLECSNRGCVTGPVVRQLLALTIQKNNPWRWRQQINFWIVTAWKKGRS